ncbi:S-adenosyl-L-methionine-dependent methyltransferase [Mycena rebaudengoi]|nr:S-adenosyl-L-methionine-dependent methyltransferase [Mycena rebaudengoi]
MASLSSLVQLSKLISESVVTLEKLSSEHNSPLPELDITAPCEDFKAIPGAAKAARVIASAGLQLAALMMSPLEAVNDVVWGVWRAAALRVCLEANVTEILREAGPEGMHADEIAAKSRLDGAKLGALNRVETLQHTTCNMHTTARIMRLLATHYIYREVGPDTFANNRLSMALDTGKPVSELFSHPENKHADTTGFQALSSFYLDHGAKSTPYVWETLRDPATSHSNRVADCAWNRWLGVDLPLMTWFEQPAHKQFCELFAHAVKGYAAIQPANLTLDAFPWDNLPKDSVVVDVAGGVGSASLILARAHPHLQFVIEDQAQVVSHGNQIWEREFPEAIASGRVRFEAHDLFAPQPVRNASIFLMRLVLHDWPFDDARKILKHLRAAATPDTVLVILDHILPYACAAGDAEDADAAPPPLLSNYGAANSLGYGTDVLIMTMVNTLERMRPDFERVLESGGWRLQRVVHIEGARGFFLPIHAVPIAQ